VMVSSFKSNFYK